MIEPFIMLVKLAGDCVDVAESLEAPFVDA